MADDEGNNAPEPVEEVEMSVLDALKEVRRLDRVLIISGLLSRCRISPLLIEFATFCCWWSAL
jgi:hypothetical protein